MDFFYLGVEVSNNFLRAALYAFFSSLFNFFKYSVGNNLSKLGFLKKLINFSLFFSSSSFYFNSYSLRSTADYYSINLFACFLSFGNSFNKFK